MEDAVDDAMQPLHSFTALLGFLASQDYSFPAAEAFNMVKALSRYAEGTLRGYMHLRQQGSAFPPQ